VLARRDEILFAEKIRRNARTWEHMDNYRRLVEDILGRVEPKIAEQIKRRPHYIETFGEAGPLSITLIAREAEAGELASRDYEFSHKSIEGHMARGYESAKKVLESGGSASSGADDSPGSNLYKF
jgi:patatin-like phospholipase